MTREPPPLVIHSMEFLSIGVKDPGGLWGISAKLPKPYEFCYIEDELELDIQNDLPSLP